MPHVTIASRMLSSLNKDIITMLLLLLLMLYFLCQAESFKAVKQYVGGMIFYILKLGFVHIRVLILLFIYLSPANCCHRDIAGRSFCQILKNSMGDTMIFLIPTASPRLNW